MILEDLFLWPAVLPALLLVPLTWLLLLWFGRSRARRLREILGDRADALAVGIGSRRRSQRRAAIIGLALALIAVMQPVWGEERRQVEQRGVDLLVCLDVSRSMLARDISPSRLQRAQQEVRALAESVHGDRMGLVVFAGEARLAVPLTRDMATFAGLVELADPLSIERGGTDLGAALELATGALAQAARGHAVVLLITDGEDQEQRGLKAAQICKESGIVVHCVGVGSERGSKIAIEEGKAFLRDRQGLEVVSSMDASGLGEIAMATGGEFVDVSVLPKPLLSLYGASILPRAGESFDGEHRRERKNRFQWPLLAAFLLWILELCLAGRRARVPSR